MKTTINPYSFALDDNTLKEGYTITYLDDNDVEITTEEYFGSTAEQWIELQGISPLMIQALTRFEQKMFLSGKSLGPKMTAVRDWLENIMNSWTDNPNARFDWPTIPYSFEETAAEAKETLTL